MASNDEPLFGNYVLLANGSDNYAPVPQPSTPLFNAIVADDEIAVQGLLETEVTLQLDKHRTLLCWSAAADATVQISTPGQQVVAVKQRSLLQVADKAQALKVVRLLRTMGARTDASYSEEISAGLGQSTAGSSMQQGAMTGTASSAREADDLVTAATSLASASRHRSSTSTVGPSAAGSSDVGTEHYGMTNEAAGRTVTEDAENDLQRPEYNTDEFRMFSFKVTRCSKRYAHDWRTCPFAHSTENARRRNPREYKYCAIACPDYKQGFCALGDNCPYAHGVFECWLHPSRYHTQLCKDGANCRRAICFFAHSLAQLRGPTQTWTPDERDLTGAAARHASAGAETSGMAAVAAVAEATASAATAAVAAAAAAEVAGRNGSGGTGALGTEAGGHKGGGTSMRRDRPAPRPAGSNSGYLQETQRNSGSSGGGSGIDLATAAAVVAAASMRIGGDEGSNIDQDSERGSPPAEGSSRGGGSGGSYGGSGTGVLSFTEPRMSNAFARRHGLNPKDNAMINMQKIALGQVAAMPSMAAGLPSTAIAPEHRLPPAAAPVPAMRAAQQAPAQAAQPRPQQPSGPRRSSGSGGSGDSTSCTVARMHTSFSGGAGLAPSNTLQAMLAAQQFNAAAQYSAAQHYQHYQQMAGLQQPYLSVGPQMMGQPYSGMPATSAQYMQPFGQAAFMPFGAPMFHHSAPFGYQPVPHGIPPHPLQGQLRAAPGPMMPPVPISMPVLPQYGSAVPMPWVSKPSEQPLQRQQHGQPGQRRSGSSSGSSVPPAGGTGPALQSAQAVHSPHSGSPIPLVSPPTPPPWAGATAHRSPMAGPSGEELN